MKALRQLGTGVVIALISVILVIGGISLALAETRTPDATPTQIPPTLQLIFPTAAASSAPTNTATPLLTSTIPPTPLLTDTLSPSTPCNPPAGWIRITTSTGDTIYSLAQRYKTSAEILSAANCLQTADLPVGYVIYVPPVPTVTVVPCGPPAGWVKTHIVQPGDNLYRIALSYGITYPQLQRANCMGSSTTIYAGQRLWVPNVPTLTPVPGATNIPDTPTLTLTATPSLTTVPLTATSSLIPTASLTSIPTATNTPTSATSASP